MRVLHSPLYGVVRAAEKKDLPALQSFAAMLLMLWLIDIIARFDRGECAGESAFHAEIVIYYVAPRSDTVVARPFLLPGIANGTSLWEPLVNDLLAKIRARGFDCDYVRGFSGPPSIEELRRDAALEVDVLRTRVRCS